MTLNPPVSLYEESHQNIQDILSKAILYNPKYKAVIVYDNHSSLSSKLEEVYKKVLPTAQFIEFKKEISGKILETFNSLQPNDLVILIQSTRFTLNDFRIRVELFKKGLKVIEHLHLGRMEGEYADRYLQSLEYDKEYYHRIGHGLKTKIDQTQSGRILSGEQELILSGPLELAKLNIGDYLEMKNVGGMYPIGEVFTESKKLEDVNGKVQLCNFADDDFGICVPENPIILEIKNGKVINVENSNSEFEVLMEQIIDGEGEVWVRELGFGLNRAFTSEKIVPDVGTYERMCGVHLSLGKKHAIYNKPEYFRRRDTKFHIDVFIDTKEVYLDEEQIFGKGEWLI